MTPREIVHAAVAAIVEQSFTDETPLADLTDSLGLVEIGVEIENHVALPMDAEFGWRTVGDLVATVEQAMGERR